MRLIRSCTDIVFQGAEPIYLHLIRPLLKPHTTTIDMILDFVATLGDFFFALLMIPVHAAIPYIPKRLQFLVGGTGAIEALAASSLAASSPPMERSESEYLDDEQAARKGFAGPYGSPPTPPPEAPSQLPADAPRIGTTHASQLGSQYQEDNTPFVPPPIEVGF
jgi:hypothetical protein